MSGAGAPDLDIAEAKDVRVAVIAGQWHEEVMRGLVSGAQDALDEVGANHRLIEVAGAFELPLAAQAALRSGYDAAVCLGVIVRGGTPHFDYVCTAVTDGLTRVQLDEGKPVGFGVLTTDTDAQALDRAGLPDSRESKGREAVEAALLSALALRALASE